MKVKFWEIALVALGFWLVMKVSQWWNDQLVDDYVPDESQTTMSLSQLNTVANLLYNSMYGFGTDEESVFELLSGKNIADLNCINKYFGKRKSDSSFSVFGDTTLSQMLRDEFSGEAYKRLQAIVSGSRIILP